MATPITATTTTTTASPACSAGVNLSNQCSPVFQYPLEFTESSGSMGSSSTATTATTSSSLFSSSHQHSVCTSVMTSSSSSSTSTNASTKRKGAFKWLQNSALKLRNKKMPDKEVISSNTTSSSSTSFVTMSQSHAHHQQHHASGIPSPKRSPHHFTTSAITTEASEVNTGCATAVFPSKSSPQSTPMSPASSSAFTPIADQMHDLRLSPESQQQQQGRGQGDQANGSHDGDDEECDQVELRNKRVIESADAAIAVELPPPMKQLSSLMITTDPSLLATHCTLSPSPASASASPSCHQVPSSPSLSSPRLPSPVSPFPVSPFHVSSLSDNSNPVSEHEKALMKRSFILNELLETERDYVRDLGLVVDGYMSLMRRSCDPNANDGTSCDMIPPMPEDLKDGKDKMVFGNIEAIYEWHRDVLLPEIEKCKQDPALLGLLFKRYERRLSMYIIYCQNKPKSEYIVSEYESYFEELRLKLGHKLQLNDLLIKPVQRITKYQLILNEMLRNTVKAGEGYEKESEDLRTAVTVMRIVPKTANDMMKVARLQGYRGKITAHGKLLKQGRIFVAEVRDSYPSSLNHYSSSSNTCSTSQQQQQQQLKFKERQVFLFEQVIILSELLAGTGASGSASNSISSSSLASASEVFIYKHDLQINKISLMDKTPGDSAHPDELKFMIRSKAPASGTGSGTSPTPGDSGSSESSAFVFLCKTTDERSQWYNSIRGILETQLDFLRALQSPIAYQKELTKDLSSHGSHEIWNPALRKTISHPAAAHKFAAVASKSGLKSADDELVIASSSSSGGGQASSSAASTNKASNESSSSGIGSGIGSRIPSLLMSSKSFKLPSKSSSKASSSKKASVPSCISTTSTTSGTSSSTTATTTTSAIRSSAAASVAAASAVMTASGILSPSSGKFSFPSP